MSTLVIDEPNRAKCGMLDAVIEAVWLLIIFLVPLAYSPYCLNPYYFVKSLVQVFLVCLLLGLVLAQWVLRGHGIDWRDLPGMIKRSPLQVIVLAFALIWMISTACSIMPGKSLWGNLAGSVGLLPNLSWIVFFLIVSWKIRSRAQVIRALYALVLSSGILCLLGIVQFFYFPYDLRGGRVLSIEGNPLSLSGFIAMTMPVTLALIIIVWYSSLSRTQKWIKFGGLLLILAVQAWCLVLAQYSITILLFVIGVFAFFILVGIFLQRKATLGLSIFSLLFIVLIAVVLLGQMLIPENGILPGESRSPNATVAEQVGLGTLPIRLQTWQCAVEVFVQSPEIPYLHDNFHSLRRFIGYGPETFIAMSQTTFPPAWKGQYTFESLVISQPENHYLYLAVTLGILGLLIFLGVLAVFFYLGMKYLMRSTNREYILLASAFVASIVQYCAHVFFDPSVITAELVFWLMLALTLALIRMESAVAVTQPGKPGGVLEAEPFTASAGIGLWRKILAAVIVLGFIVLGGLLTIPPLLGNMYIQSGLTLYNVNKNGAMEMYAEATKVQPGQSYYYNFLGNLAYVMAQQSKDQQEKTKLLSQSEAAYADAIKVDPAMAIWYYRLADVDVYWALNGNNEKYGDALSLYEKADRIFPGNPVILDKWGLALTFKGDYQAAGETLDNASLSDPLWIQTSFYKGLLEAYRGDKEAAAKLFISPVGDNARDISFFINFCSLMATYGTGPINSVSGALEYSMAGGGGDWKGYALQGIADVYSSNYPAAVQAFSKSADLAPDDDVTLVAGIVNAMLSNQSAYQDQVRQIVGGLMDRASKINSK